MLNSWSNIDHKLIDKLWSESTIFFVARNLHNHPKFLPHQEASSDAVETGTNEADLAPEYAQLGGWRFTPWKSWKVW